MVQRVKVIAAKLDDLSSIPEKHMVKERTDSHKSSSDHYTHAVTRARHSTWMDKSLNCEALKEKDMYIHFSDNGFDNDIKSELGHSSG